MCTKIVEGEKVLIIHCDNEIKSDRFSDKELRKYIVMCNQNLRGSEATYTKRWLVTIKHAYRDLVKICKAIFILPVYLMRERI